MEFKNLTEREKYIFNAIDEIFLKFSSDEKKRVIGLLFDKYCCEVTK